MHSDEMTLNRAALSPARNPAAALPVACTLGPDDGPSRMRRWQHLAATAAPAAWRVGHQLEVRYQPVPGVLEELEALAAAEAQCCRFVTWEVTVDQGMPVLHVGADPATPEDLAPIADLFGAAAAGPR